MAWIVGLRPDETTTVRSRGPWIRETFAQVGVVGCGLMGSGIVEVLARAGADVTFVEGTDELVARGRAAVERSVGKAVERGKLDAADAEALLGRVRGVTDLAGLDGLRPGDRGGDRGRRGEAGDLPDARRGHAAGGRPRLNTSSIPIVELAVASGRPDRVIGMHFFNPPPVMALLELTPSVTTSDETLAFVRAYGTDVLGKTCVRRRTTPGSS